jgi:hypothetical protein
MSEASESSDHVVHRSAFDDLLFVERTCRVCTVNRDGSPHISPIWFVWDGTAIWLNSLVESRRWRNIEHDPRVSVVVDRGDRLGRPRGVELMGEAFAVGEVPRGHTADMELVEPERLFGAKYSDGGFVPDGRHGWLRVSISTIVSDLVD